jgi:hypothetical protein
MRVHDPGCRPLTVSEPNPSKILDCQRVSVRERESLSEGKRNAQARFLLSKEAHMNLFKSGCWGLVLDSEGLPTDISEYHARPQRRSCGGVLSGHFILERYTVDDEGNISLTPTLPIVELSTSVDLFKAEFDSLLEQVRKRFPDRQLSFPPLEW